MLTDCRACVRLAHFLDEVKRANPGYHCKPVPPFGDAHPRLLIVGLAPGMHGANRSGRPFTGDHAGILLYETLHEFGFGSRPQSLSVDDGLVLANCRITNAVKCLPPANKPEGAEIRQCNSYLKAELESLADDAAILALGSVAHAAILMALGLKAKDHPFGHGSVHLLHPSLPFRGSGTQREGAFRLYDSYHCSRYNTQTKRLTPDMFRAVFSHIKQDMEE
ncbi:MAG TPA: uracil-DNA glycosylase [Thiobacillaceae bacterium]|nr:uracil-DNA glycosylase [Thiobacillaceae bacterium]